MLPDLVEQDAGCSKLDKVSWDCFSTQKKCLHNAFSPIQNGTFNPIKHIWPFGLNECFCKAVAYQKKEDFHAETWSKRERRQLSSSLLGFHMFFSNTFPNSPDFLINAIVTKSFHRMNGYSVILWKLEVFEFWLVLSLPLLYGHTRGGGMRPPSWWNASTAQIRQWQNSDKTNPLESSTKQCRIAMNCPVDNTRWCFHLLRLLHHGPLHTSIAWHETMEKHPTIIINT